MHVLIVEEVRDDTMVGVFVCSGVCGLEKTGNSGVALWRVWLGRHSSYCVSNGIAGERGRKYGSRYERACGQRCSRHFVIADQCVQRWRSGGWGWLVFPGFRSVPYLAGKSEPAVFWAISLQFVWNWSDAAWCEETGIGEKSKNSISAIFAADGNLVGVFMKKLSGSYTVEAAFVMSAVLLVMSALIRFAYLQCRQTTGVMRLHEMVEIMAHREQGEERWNLDSAAYEIYVERKGGRIEGRILGDGWERTIQSRVFEPEEWIRKSTLLPESEETEVQ